MHLPKTRQDLSRWQALGDYETKLLEVYKNFIDVWGTAFPKQELSLHVSKVLDLSPSFCERVVDAGLSRFPNRFSIQSCQLTGRKEDTGVMTYDLVQKYRDRAHHGFQSLAGLNRPDGRMGSPEMAALNLVHAGAEYWELWHGDGFSVDDLRSGSERLARGKAIGLRSLQKKTDRRRQISPAQMSLEPNSRNGKTVRRFSRRLPGGCAKPSYFFICPRPPARPSIASSSGNIGFRRCIRSIRSYSNGRPHTCASSRWIACGRPGCSRVICFSVCIKFCPNRPLTSRCCVIRLRGCFRRSISCAATGCIRSIGSFGVKNGRSRNSCNAPQEIMCNARS